jgi:hypothetical protein
MAFKRELLTERRDDDVIYPCVRRCCWPADGAPGDYIVLFRNRNEGTVVWSLNTDFPVGAYRDGFSPDCFEYYEGEIKLRNGVL